MNINKIIEEAKEDFEKLAVNEICTQNGKVWIEKKIIIDFLSHSLTKGIQKAMEGIRLEKKDVKGDYVNIIYHLQGYNSACEELDTKINQLLDK